MTDQRSHDLMRCFEFVQRADMVGTRTEPFAFGTAVFLPELPLRHDSNYLLVDTLPDVDAAAALTAQADALQGGAGPDHRCLMFRDAEMGERLAPDLTSRGWKRFRGVVMAHRREPEREVDTTQVVRTDDRTLRDTRTRNILREPWATPEVARQLLASRAYSPVPTEVYAAFVDGAPVSWAELYCEGGVAQVESVATEPEFRNRGFASAIVLRCVDEARLRGADLVFLCADAEDWPARLYERLGFEEIGRYVKLFREPPSGAA
jgi:ribosomal protein S18 acetylase RimI-like enzyme